MNCYVSSISPELQEPNFTVQVCAELEQLGKPWLKLFITFRSVTGNLFLPNYLLALQVVFLCVGYREAEDKVSVGFPIRHIFFYKS